MVMSLWLVSCIESFTINFLRSNKIFTHLESSVHICWLCAYLPAAHASTRGARATFVPRPLG